MADAEEGFAPPFALVRRVLSERPRLTSSRASSARGPGWVPLKGRPRRRPQAEPSAHEHLAVGVDRLACDVPRLPRRGRAAGSPRQRLSRSQEIAATQWGQSCGTPRCRCGSMIVRMLTSCVSQNPCT